MTWAHLLSIAYFVLHATFIGRALYRPNRDPASRLAWILAILLIPVGGIVAYVLLGETSVGRRRKRELRAILDRLPRPHGWDGSFDHDPQDRYAAPFIAARNINRLGAVRCPRPELMADANEAIDRVVADIEAATDSVHICFYIWLTDTNGLKLVEAVRRAALRGVAVRAMADGVGSADMIASHHWRRMASAGVKLDVALQVGNPVLRVLFSRIDLRNHRKVVVVDNAITYFGSQNAADAEFRVKAKYAPWIDVMMRFTGPVAQQHQYLFASDWMAEGHDDLGSYLSPDNPEPPDAPVIAQVMGTGPTLEYAAMSEVFCSMLHTAAREVIITTPYFVPDDSLMSDIVAVARRGVSTTLILPARNDSRVVAGASRSYYADMLDAGVRLFEYEKGLLHAKTLTVDGEIALIGSANMDRRSFDLNFENNILMRDRQTTAALRARQMEWQADSRAVSPGDVARWGVARKLLNNLLVTVSPIL
ncbi:cardiolipin synthase [Novosphingobium sp. ZN18A2]|uniref:cardiolipin synthase n=1 Tax=Novosphingobium sp. ZN18A2 TaxID=3079861 RepID=UPI0030D44359